MIVVFILLLNIVCTSDAYFHHQCTESTSIIEHNIYVVWINMLDGVNAVIVWSMT